jgi:hypothetical protein
MWVLGLIEKTRSTVAGQYRVWTGFPHEANMWLLGQAYRGRFVFIESHEAA